MNTTGIRIAMATILCAGLLAADANAQGRPADEPEVPPNKVTWSFLEIGYQYADLDNASSDGDGIGVELSVKAKEHYHLVVDYRWFALASSPADSPDITNLFVGLGGHYSVLENMDVFVDAGYVLKDVDSELMDDREGGIGTRAGFRTMFASKLELGLLGTYSQYFDDYVIGGRASARLYISNLFSLGANVSYDDNDDLQIFGGVRFDFERT